MYTDADLQDIESRLEALLRDVRALRGQESTAPAAARPRTGAELLRALGMTTENKQDPPAKWMLGFLLEFGPTRKSELIRLFAEAMDSAYSSERRAISGMAQAINQLTGGEDPKMVAVENRRGTIVKVEFIRNSPVTDKHPPTAILIEDYSHPDQIIALPRHVGMRWRYAVLS